METLYSVLKNLFPFKGYKPYVFQNEVDIIIGLKSRRKLGICPICGKRCNSVETEYERAVRDLDFGQHKCFLCFKQKKIRCSCGYRGPEMLDFVSKSKRVTKRMELYIVSLCSAMSLKDVARITKLDWKTIKSVDFEYLKSIMPDIAKLNITKIAIDEIAIMKGHKYFTIIRDYDTGIALRIILGRKYEETSKALASLGKEKLKNIKYVSMDMWDPYIKAVNEQCPNAKIIFDKFHVVKKINEALDTIRKKEFANADKEERINMKHKRFVILAREKNINAKQREELKILMQSNEKLFKAYLLKEQVLSIFDDKNSTFEQIKDRLQTWMENILSNDLEEFHAVLNTMQNYLYGILNYFRYGLTNAIAEGFNTKINIIKRRAFGFRDIEYFMLKIYQSSIERFA